jgi:hypothetical protein
MQKVGFKFIRLDGAEQVWTSASRDGKQPLQSDATGRRTRAARRRFMRRLEHQLPLFCQFGHERN